MYLTVLKYNPEIKKHKNRYWDCQCKCGNTISVATHYLRSGHTKSCGCYGREQAGIRGLTLNRIHGKSGTPEYVLHMSAKRRAKVYSVPFSLKIEDIVIPSHCPILSVPLISNKGGKVITENSPSLDRRIPELGYIKGNVHVISVLANRLKSNNNNPSFFRALADYLEEDFEGFGHEPLVNKYLKEKEKSYESFNPIF